MIGRSGERELGISVLAARHNDDGDILDDSLKTLFPYTSLFRFNIWRINLITNMSYIDLEYF